MSSKIQQLPPLKIHSNQVIFPSKEDETSSLINKDTTTQKLKKIEIERTDLERQSEQINQKVKVFIRSRPLLSFEDQDDNFLTLNEQDNTLTISEEFNQIQQTFDKAFGPNSTQSDVFKQFKEPIEKVIEGYNFTIFAYGQTGSGKTYTMFGCDWENLLNSGDRQSKKRNFDKISIPQQLNSQRNNQSTFFEQLDSDINYAGVIPRTIFQLFSQVSEKRNQSSDSISINIYCSFLQIYNEKIYDLLAETNTLKPLQIHESKLDGIFVEGLSEYQVNHYLDTLQLMQRGERNRTIRQTSLNSKSSRSHTIFQLITETRLNNSKDTATIKRARINLCDLAGSEKVNKNEIMEGAHLNELRNINLSLTSLGKVINCLSTQGNNKMKMLVIPFRESKLTRILQDSLVGNTITYIISTISPSIQNMDETISTLKFAERARHITMTIKPNQINSTNDENIKKLQKEVQYLKELLNLRRKGQSFNDIHSKFIRLQVENDKLRKEQISMKEVEKLIDENRKMKLEIQQIFMNSSITGSPTSQQMTLPEGSPLLNKQDNEQRFLVSQPQSESRNLHSLDRYLQSNQDVFYLGKGNYSERINKSNKKNQIIKQEFFPNIINSNSPHNIQKSKSFNQHLRTSHPNISCNQSSDNDSFALNQFSRNGKYEMNANTLVKVRIRNRQQQYTIKDGYIEASEHEISEQNRKQKDKKMILERLGQLERIQQHHQDQLQRDLLAIQNSSDLKSHHKKNLSQPNINQQNCKYQDYLKGISQIDKQKKQLRTYEDKIKEIQKRYFSFVSK